jgi:acetyl-CoA C-acetyltransferase
MAGSKLVVIGVGQVRRRPELDGGFEPLEPARLAALALERAAADAGDARLLAEADFLGCTKPLAWHYDDLPSTVASAVGARARRRRMMPSGGESPVSLLHEVASLIEHGEVRLALLAGADTVYARRRAARDGIALEHWTAATTRPDVFEGMRPIANELEMRHGLSLPSELYPLFENALRARAGRSIEAHQVHVSELMARLSAVAASYPQAWFPEPRSAREIREPSAGNRWICFPYTKRMNAIMDVDQAAALVVTSEAEAERRGIPRERRVTLLGGARATDAWTPTERPDFVSSPAYRRAARRALERAALEAREVDLFDLYSCFPCAVEIAQQELGLAADDPRPLTVTGGLACAGGPGNNYAMHALGRMTERLRALGSGVGYVSGLGMTVTKHAVALLSSDPRRIAAAAGGAEEVALPEAELRGPELVAEPDGPGRIETYTVWFDRENRPERSAIVVRLDDGRRTVAHGEPTPAALARLVESEGVGLRGKASPGQAGAPNRFALEG